MSKELSKEKQEIVDKACKYINDNEIDYLEKKFKKTPKKLIKLLIRIGREIEYESNRN